MIREAQEEAGIGPDKSDLALAHAMHRFENQERVGLFFKATRVAEPDKTRALEWFEVDRPSS